MRQQCTLCSKIHIMSSEMAPLTGGVVWDDCGLRGHIYLKEVYVVVCCVTSLFLNSGSRIEYPLETAFGCGSEI